MAFNHTLGRAVLTSKAIVTQIPAPVCLGEGGGAVALLDRGGAHHSGLPIFGQASLSFDIDRSPHSHKHQHACTSWFSQVFKSVSQALRGVANAKTVQQTPPRCAARGLTDLAGLGGLGGGVGLECGCGPAALHQVVHVVQVVRHGALRQPPIRHHALAVLFHKCSQPVVVIQR